MSALVVASMVLLVFLVGLGALMLGVKAVRAEADRVHTTRRADVGGRG